MMNILGFVTMGAGIGIVVVQEFPLAATHPHLATASLALLGFAMVLLGAVLDRPRT